MTPTPPTTNTGGWNSSGDNNTTPSSGKLALGWVVDEKPASSYFNWYMAIVDTWITWLNDFTTEAVTFFQAVTFSGTVNLSGTTNVLGSMLVPAAVGIQGGGSLVVESGGAAIIQNGGNLQLNSGAIVKNNGIVAAGGWGVNTTLGSSGVKSAITSQVTLCAVNVGPAGMYRVDVYCISASGTQSPSVEVEWTDVNAGNIGITATEMTLFGGASTAHLWLVSFSLWVTNVSTITVNIAQGASETLTTAAAAVTAVY